MQQALIDEVGGKWFHVHGDPYQERGVSDLIGCVGGKFIAIEVKMPGKKLTEYQEDFLSGVTANGGLGFSSDDIRYSVKVVKGWIKGGVIKSEHPKEKGV